MGLLGDGLLRGPGDPPPPHSELRRGLLKLSCQKYSKDKVVGVQDSALHTGEVEGGGLHVWDQAGSPRPA